jgi:hypothetical protein
MCSPSGKSFLLVGSHPYFNIKSPDSETPAVRQRGGPAFFDEDDAWLPGVDCQAKLTHFYIEN